ncbi:hypothetical protein BAU15_00845 [Enterococcus sp. JM4C]|uniref:alpha/beta hydrolase n=1 Tax=Candidatus Enterococcus huntleyi TaxID=1857217 RepID=UPI001379F8B3|nr:alpha/beta hydrolase [Enterococcus sp. JM4C]KAF1299224.1 hypothetical protein BAU15_00845 [Enterococcus sp. JM4C]
MKKIISQISSYQDLPINYSFYPSHSADAPTIIYFHGGGLVFGQRDDLPEDYISLLIEGGYNFLSLDYLLAPESTLATIIAQLTDSLTTLLKKLQLTNYHFMGRSAGTYLAYYLIQQGFTPRSLLAFYGYYQLTTAEFSLPTPYYLRYPFIPAASLEKLIETTPLTQGSMNKRYPLYLAGRQQGSWLKYLTSDKQDLTKFSLEEDDLQKMPPTLLIHADNDPDVPYYLSKKAAQLIPKSQLITINQDQHDFDRTVTEETRAIYQKVLAFLDEVHGA